MLEIVALGLAAAVFPLLIACVAILISRPEPRRLLLAFYVGGMLVSIVTGVVLLGVFEDQGTVLGNSSSDPSPGESIVAGVLALALAWVMVSGAGRRRLDIRRARHPREREDSGPSWPERHLASAGAPLAFVVGAAINLPGPFYILALGEISTGGYSDAAAFALIVLFNLIMFVLLELPLVGYVVQPERTEVLVGRLAAWLNANGLKVMGYLAGAVGVGLVVQGVAAAA